MAESTRPSGEHGDGVGDLREGRDDVAPVELPAVTHPSDAQRPRWRMTVEETGFPDERAVVVWVDDETSFRIMPWSIMRWTDERIDQFAEQVVALSADLGRAREALEKIARPDRYDANEMAQIARALLTPAADAAEGRAQ